MKLFLLIKFENLDPHLNVLKRISGHLISDIVSCDRNSKNHSFEFVIM